MGDRVQSELWEWVKAIIIALTAVFVIKSFLFDVIVIDGISMEPTLHNNDRVFVNVIGYKLNPPKYKDVIIFTPSIDKKAYYIKRVIGVPGDTVQIKNNKVYINGKALNESYLPEGTSTRSFSGSELTVKVPEGRVFVMGDNRNNSEDSRDPRLGTIPISSIKGRAIYRLFPFDSMKML